MNSEIHADLAGKQLFSRMLRIKGSLQKPEDFKLIELTPNRSYAFYRAEKYGKDGLPSSVPAFICNICTKISPHPVLDYKAFDPELGTEEIKKVIDEQMGIFCQENKIVPLNGLMAVMLSQS